MNIRVRAPLLGAALFITLAACAGTGPPTGTPDPSRSVGAPQADASAFDQAFIDMMVPHHQSAIEAAKAAETRAQKPEIKNLAKQIIADQQREVEQMQQWRRSWFG